MNSILTFQERGDAFFDKWGYKYDGLGKQDIRDFNSNNFFGQGTSKDGILGKISQIGATEKYPECVLVDDYTILSNLVIIVGDQVYTPRTEHRLRVERSIPEGTYSTKIQRIEPTLIDFDNFMRGNPYPQMPEILI